MIELLVLMGLCRHMGALARRKGRTAVKYQFMLVAFWFGGEIVGAVLAMIGLEIPYGDSDKSLFVIYIAGWVGAIIAAVLAFRIVGGLPELVDEEDSWDDTSDDLSVKKDSSL